MNRGGTQPRRYSGQRTNHKQIIHKGSTSHVRDGSSREVEHGRQRRRARGQRAARVSGVRAWAASHTDGAAAQRRRRGRGRARGRAMAGRVRRRQRRGGQRGRQRIRRHETIANAAAAATITRSRASVLAQAAQRGHGRSWNGSRRRDVPVRNAVSVSVRQGGGAGGSERPGAHVHWSRPHRRAPSSSDDHICGRSWS